MAELWTGIEIEGRFAGIPSLFVRKTTRGRFDMILAVCRKHNLGHVWLCKETVEKWELAQFLLDNDLVVSVETTPDELDSRMYPFRRDNKSRLVVTLDLPPGWFQNLLLIRLNDEIRLSFGEFYSIGFAQQNAWFTREEDYQNDIELDYPQ